MVIYSPSEQLCSDGPRRNPLKNSKKKAIIAAILTICAVLALIMGGMGSSASAGGYSGVSTVALRQLEKLSTQAKLAGKICNAKSDARRASLANRFERRKFELDLELDRLGYPFETPKLSEFTTSLTVEGKCPAPAGDLG